MYKRQPPERVKALLLGVMLGSNEDLSVIELADLEKTLGERGGRIPSLVVVDTERGPEVFRVAIGKCGTFCSRNFSWTQFWWKPN